MRAETGERASAGVPVAIVAASVLVLGACLLTGFRVAFAADPETLIRVNGPRVLIGAGVGALFATAGVLRQTRNAERPLRELEWLAASVAGAAVGFWLAQRWGGVPSLLVFAIGAVPAALFSGWLVRRLDRPRRATNFGVLGVLGLAVLGAALAGTYARARQDSVAATVAWLLGDLTGASGASGAGLVGLAVGLAIAAVWTRGAARERVEWIALGIGIGAAGPLAFVGGMVPRSVRALTHRGAESLQIAASAVAGAATVVAIDSVPRLLLGGYDFPFNVPAALLAIPIYLGWNRARLRREVGPAPLWFETVEVGMIVAATGLAAALAYVLVSVVRSAT